MPTRYDLFIIGTASLDTLHLPGQPPTDTIGGAGLYTALAAHKAGATVGLFGPHPYPMPVPLQPAAARLTWLGPTVPPAGVAALEIAHYGGGKAQLLHASWGAEPAFKPENLPPELLNAAIIHVAALSSAARQLEFVVALRQAMPQARLSVGTYGRLVYEEGEHVRQIFDLADMFFMNENEARGLFGSVAQAATAENKLLFVTLGEQGAMVIDGSHKTELAATPITEVDPTGAGDTFCGGTLAGLTQGHPPVEAATHAMTLAAQTVSQIGPAALLA